MSEDFNMPKTQRHPTALPVEKIAKAHANRNEAIMAMYATGEYSYPQIAAFFNLYVTSAGMIVRSAKANSKKTGE